MNRKEIITRIGDLAEWTCGPCTKHEGIPYNQRPAWCNQNCEVGKELLRLGNQLTEVRKMKLTKDVYLQEKENKLSDSQIKKKYGIDQNNFYKFKKKYDLIGKLPRANAKEEVVEQKEEAESSDVWELKFKHLQGDYDGLKQLSEKLQEENRTLKAEKNALITENEGLEDENKKMNYLKDMVGEIKAENQHLDDELAEKQHELDELKNDNDELDIGWEEMKDELTATKAKYEKLVEYVKVVM